MNYPFATKIKPFLQDRHMCVNYTPTRKENLTDFGVNCQHLDDYKAETWQDYAAPIIRHSNHWEREVMLASYGMIPKEKNATENLVSDFFSLDGASRTSV